MRGGPSLAAPWCGCPKCLGWARPYLWPQLRGRRGERVTTTWRNSACGGGTPAPRSASPKRCSSASMQKSEASIGPARRQQPVPDASDALENTRSHPRKAPISRGFRHFWARPGPSRDKTGSAVPRATPRPRSPKAPCPPTPAAATPAPGCPGTGGGSPSEATRASARKPSRR